MRYAVVYDTKSASSLQFHHWYPDQDSAIKAATALVNPEKGKPSVITDVWAAYVFRLTHTVRAEVSVEVKIQATEELKDG